MDLEIDSQVVLFAACYDLGSFWERWTSCIAFWSSSFHHSLRLRSYRLPVSRYTPNGWIHHSCAGCVSACKIGSDSYLMQWTDRVRLPAEPSLMRVRFSMREICRAIGMTTVNPDLLTAAERLHYEGYLCRQEDNGTILKQAQSGATIKEIVRRTGRS